MIVKAPALSGQSNQPLLPWAAASATPPLNYTQGSAWWNTPGYGFATLQLTTQTYVLSTINQMRAAGITVWVKFI
jgi:hypothetical protein